MPDIKFNLPNVPNTPWQDSQFTFDGKWLPNIDATLIGPQNYAILENFRYLTKGLQGVRGYTRVNSDNALSTYTNIRNGIQLKTERTQDSYILVHAQDSSGNGKIFVNKGTIGSKSDFEATALHTDASANLIGRFSTAPQGNIVYCNGEESMIYGGEEQNLGGCFTVDNNSGDNPINVTDAANNSLQTTDNYFDIGTSQSFLLILTTRPVKGFKFYIKTANGTASTGSFKYWDGSAWQAVSNPSDGTSSSGVALAQTGMFSFDSTVDNVKPKHFQEMYMYAYLYELSAGSADVYHITADMPFQDIVDIWDGVYRQPIQFQVYDVDHYEDYTLHVNQSSDVNTPVGGQLDGLVAASDYVIIMFEEQITAIKLTMLGDLLNSNASNMTVSYWDGSAWQSVSGQNDGTASGGVTLSQTGLVSWDTPSNEEEQTLFGSAGYAYKLTFSANLSGTKGGSAEVLIDLVTGIPAQKIVEAFDFSVLYKNRVMLGGFSAGDAGNRMDYCATNAPDVWNGVDSSNDGRQSLYFGGVEKLTGAAQLYNRFGSNIFAMLVVFKEVETYLLTGTTPSDFQIYPVSLNIGCPAPLTITTAELGFSEAVGAQRQVVLWLSHAGPMMFDGAMITPISDIENYFDPSKSEYINLSYISRARGWFDKKNKEWNLLIPTGSSTECDTWLVYDVIQKRWYKRTVGTAHMPQAGWTVMDSNGDTHSFGGIDSGYMVHLDYGKTYDAPSYSDLTGGVGILQRVKTGDFWPSNNVWDTALLRKYKLLIKKLPDTGTTHTVSIYSYTDTEQNSGGDNAFVDEDNSSGIYTSFEDTTDNEWAAVVTTTADLGLDIGLQRIISLVKDLNQSGWAHAFELQIETTDIDAGVEPIAWGIEYRVERKDNTAT